MSARRRRRRSRRTPRRRTRRSSGRRPGSPAAPRTARAAPTARTCAAEPRAGRRGRNGSSTPKPSSPGTGRMFSTNASTWISARHDSADREPDRHRHHGDGQRQHRADDAGWSAGPASDTRLRAGRGERIAPVVDPHRAAGQRDAAEQQEEHRQHERQADDRCSGGCRGSGSPWRAPTGRRRGRPRSACAELVQAQRHRPPAEHQQHDPRVSSTGPRLAVPSARAPPRPR